jgi:hypothetical protein
MFTVFFFYIESPKGIKDAAKIIPKVAQLHPCAFFLVKKRQQAINKTMSHKVSGMM